jgi:HSP20 family protein
MKRRRIMAIVRWNPFRELEDIQTRLNRLFSEAPARTGEESFQFADWMPAVDIQETDHEYSVKVDLPEVKKEDVKVNVENGALTIEGERKKEKEEKGKKFHRVEREYGQFVRRFMMPVEVDAAKVQAEFKDGVLRVTLPKTAASTPRHVDVKVA